MRCYQTPVQKTEGIQAKCTLTLNLSAKADQVELEIKKGRKIIWSGSRDLKRQNNFCAEEGDKTRCRDQMEKRIS